ncbi:MAG: hypothetical protein H0U77_01615 [Nocardioidaceae bacterium]|nr:hypothetical protein [Nocardioidaceae bacterium]
MPYVHVAHTPGQSLADYRAVAAEAVGDDPPQGLLVSIAGDADGALHTVDVWDSQASADRFAAERLFPAFQKTGRGPGAEATYVVFETDQVSLDGGAR